MLSRLLLPRRLGSLPPRLGPRLSCALASPPSSICHLNSNECINEVSGGRFRYHSSPSLDVPRPKKITTALPPTPLKESKPTSKGKAKEEEIPKAKVEGNSKGEAKRDEGKGLLTSSMSNEIPKRRGRPPKVEVAEKIAMETPNVNPDNKSNIPSIEELPEKKKRGRKPKETSATEKEKEEEGVATKRRRSRSTAIIIDWYCKVCEAPNPANAHFCTACSASRSGTPAPEKDVFSSSGKRVIYVCFDVDSTGLNPCYEHIVKLTSTAVGTEGKKRFNELVYTDRKIPFEASRASGKDRANAVLNRWFDWLASLTRSSSDVIVLVANYGLGFDFTLLLFEMLRQNISWNKLKALNVHFLDSHEFFKSLGRFSSNRLATVYEEVLKRKFPTAPSQMRDVSALEELLFTHHALLSPSSASFSTSTSTSSTPFSSYDDHIMTPFYLVDHMLHFHGRDVQTMAEAVHNLVDPDGQDSDVNTMQPWDLSDQELMMIHHALHESTDGTVTFRDVPYKIRFGQKKGERIVRIYGVSFIERVNSQKRITLIGRKDKRTDKYSWITAVDNTMLV